MSWTEYLEPYFTEKVRKAGEELFRTSPSLEATCQEDRIGGRIKDANSYYRTIMDISDVDTDGTLRANCDCGIRRGLCPHLWATLMRLDQVLGIGAAGQRERGPDWRQTLGSISNSLVAETKQPGESPTRRASQQRLAYWIIDFSRSAADKSVVIAFRQREANQKGQWGKLKLANLANVYPREFQDPIDAHLVSLLRRWEGYDGTSYATMSYYSPRYYGRPSHEITISPELYDLALPLMAKSGRLHWMMDSYDTPDLNPPLMFDDRHHQLFLRIEADENEQCWYLHGMLGCQPEEPGRPLSEVVLVLGDAWVLMQDRMISLMPRHAAWVRQLRSNIPLRIPFADRAALVSMLATAPALPDLTLPPDLQWREEVVQPSPRFHVTYDERSPRFVYGQVWFDYGQNRARYGQVPGSWFDADTNSRLVRDLEAEDTFLHTAVSLLGQDQSVLPPNFDADVMLPSARLTEVVQQLNTAGWHVEAKGKRLRRAGEISIAVESGIDWFDVDARVSFGETSIALPQLLKALGEGRDTVVLDDGTLGLVAEDWLKKYAGWGKLAEDEDGKFRFKASQALLLDALLVSETGVAVDAQYAELRERMAQFRGIRAAQPGAGFQGALRGYQQEGLGWLQFLEQFGLGGCLADDMGLGKTVQVLAHLVSRRESEPQAARKPSLVVVPKSLVFNWIQEAERFAPGLKVANYTGTARVALRDKLAEFDVVITTYGTMRRDVLELKEHAFDYVILDESQAVKNAKSLSAKSSRLLKADHRLAMTGTPVENHLGELWSLFEFLNPGLLGRNGVFDEAVRNPGPDNETVHFLSKALSPYILRRTKQQVLTELPEKSEQTIYCDLSIKERKYYNELRDYYRAMLDKDINKRGLQKAKIHVLEALLRLRQAACHPGLIDKNRISDPSAKTQVLVQQLSELAEEGHKALIFSQFTSLLAIVREQLDKQGIAYEYLDGRTRDRRAKVERFQNNDACKLFLISLKAGGVGLNLTAADYVFILDPWWNPAVEAQAIDRTHRIGQTKRVFAYRLIARDTVEEKVLQLQESKRELAEAIIRADDSLIRNLTVEDLQLLLG